MTIVSWLLPLVSTHPETASPQDSTIEFEKRRHVPVRYDRELVQTTIKAIKRIGEIKSRREHAFWKSRLVSTSSFCVRLLTHLHLFRMAASRQKKLAHRKKVSEAAKVPVKLVPPIEVPPEGEKVREKIKVSTKARSALVPGTGRSMGMEID
jgi:large subunit ribosomal protein L24e